MTRKQAIEIYDQSPRFKQFWENSNGGLLLAVCSSCGQRQTRETYCNGFWKEFFTIDQDYTVRAIAMHSCGQWHQYLS